MTFAVFVDGEGYVADVSAPSREEAVKFLMCVGYAASTIELREVVE